jgi:hypothetical protein
MADQIIKDIRLVEFSSGLFDDLSVSDSLIPKNAVRHAVNVMFNRPRGDVTQRAGTTVLGDQAGAGGNDILGLYNFRSSTASYNKLICSTGTVLRYLNGTTWTDTVTGLTTSLKTRFITYLDSFAFLNGTDQPQSWTGTGAWTTTGGALDIANFPKAKFAVILNGRVLCAGVSATPNRILESSQPSTGAISWTSGNRYVDIQPQDGAGSLTGVASNGRIAVIFKERAMYRYDGSSLIFITGVGTTCHDSIVTDDEGVMYFFGQGSGNVGFYATTGGYPKKISRAVQKWVEAIDPTFYDKINGYTDGESIFWDIGSVTINGKVYTNAELVYNFSDQTWEVNSYADRFMIQTQYITSTGTVTRVAGDTDGYVQTMDSGTTDNGTPISWECEFAPFSFTGLERSKVINEVCTIAKNIQGTNVYAKEDNKIWKTIGGMKKPYERFKNLNLKFHQLSMKIAGINSNAPFQFMGFVFPEIIDKGVTDDYV